jgi:hypothetical protein
VTPILVILSGLVVLGGVATVSATMPRLAVLGLFLALTGAAYVADPLPGPLGLGARLAGTTLGTYLVWIALRRGPVTLPVSSIGWWGALLVAAAAFVAGFLAAGTLGSALAGGSPEGPGTGGVAAALMSGSLVARVGVGAALALAALAIPEVAIARDTLRMGVGLLLLLAATSLTANALYGIADPVEELAMALATAASGAAVGALITASLRHGGDLRIRDSLRPDAVIRHRAADDAYPVDAGAGTNDRVGRPEAEG